MKLGIRFLIRITQKHAPLVLAAMLIIYGYVLSMAALIRHWSLGTYYYDLGIMHQVVYNTSRGRILELTDPQSAAQISRFAIHFDPLMAIFSPFYWIYPKAELLLVGQSVALVLGAIPIYLLAVHIFKKKAQSAKIVGLFFAFLYLNYLPLHKINSFDFHAIVLAVPLLLWAFYFAQVGRYRLSLGAIVLSFAAKENVAAAAFMIGVYFLFVKKKRRFGIVVSSMSLIVFILVLGLLIPSHRSNLHFASSYFSADVSTNLARLLSWETFSYTQQILQPLAFVSLLSPSSLLIALPEWSINVLSKNSNMRDLQYHYAAILIPFIFISAMYGFKKIYPKKLLTVLFIAVSLYGIGQTLQYSWTHMQTNAINQAKAAVIGGWQERLTDRVPVATSGHLAPYFSARPHFYNFLFDFAYGNFGLTDDDIKEQVTRYENAEFVLLQKGEMDNPHPLVGFYYNHLKKNSRFRLVFDEEGIEVYRKIR